MNYNKDNSKKKSPDKNVADDKMDDKKHCLTVKFNKPDKRNNSATKRTSKFQHGELYKISDKGLFTT